MEDSIHLKFIQKIDYLNNNLLIFNSLLMIASLVYLLRHQQAP